MDKYQIIRRPIVTEKTTKLVDQNKYTFEVDRGANKIEIKLAVEEIFNVKVTKVNVINELAKAKKVGQHSGFKPAVSKAIVTLAEGFKIDVYKA
jgi:large subunit ribosomal protein L23